MRDTADTIPVELQTPFRAALVRAGITAVSVSRGKKLTTHLVKNMRPLCGVPKSKGRMSDLTWYAVESITCARCVRSFHRMQRENAATAGKVIDLMDALKTSLSKTTNERK
jgi:hypothetical protein